MGTEITKMAESICQNNGDENDIYKEEEKKYIDRANNNKRKDRKKNIDDDILMRQFRKFEVLLNELFLSGKPTKFERNVGKSWNKLG